MEIYMFVKRKRGRKRRVLGATTVIVCCSLWGGCGLGGWWQQRQKWMERKMDVEEGTAPFLFWSPCGRFGTVMMGLGGMWVGVWCCPTNTNPPIPHLLSLTYALVGDFCACFGEGGYGLAGPLWRVCSAGKPHLMVCVCVCARVRACVFILVMVFIC